MEPPKPPPKALKPGAPLPPPTNTNTNTNTNATNATEIAAEIAASDTTTIVTTTQPIKTSTTGKWTARSLLVVCTFPFIPAAQPAAVQLALKSGEELQVTEECNGWLKGYLISSSARRCGIFPATHVRQIQSIGDGGQVLSYYQREKPMYSNALVNEMTMVLREWDVLLKRFYQEKRYVEFSAVKTRMVQLTQFRRELLHPTVDDGYRRRVKPIIISKIDEGRRILGLDMIPRLENGEPADESNTAIIQLLSLHTEMKLREKEAQFRRGGVGFNPTVAFKKSSTITSSSAANLNVNANVASSSSSSSSSLTTSSSVTISGSGSGSSSSSSSSSSSPATSPTSPTTTTTNAGNSAATTALSLALAAAASGSGPRLYQLLLDMQACVCPVGENNEIFFTIYERKNEKTFVAITEPYVVHLTEYGMPHNVDRIGKIKTVIKDFSPRDFDVDLWLVAKIHRKGKLLTEVEGAASTSSMQGSKKDVKDSLRFRRPFGCAVLQLTKETLSLGAEHMMTIYFSRDELSFPSLHESIINKVGNFDIVPRSKGIAVCVKAYAGDYPSLIEDLPDWKDYPITQKLGFPDVILPGEVRNDFYISLESCEVLQDRKTAPKNVEISVQVLLENGQPIPNAITPGTGESPVTEYRSMVYYHTNSPKLGETIRVNVPFESFEQAHLFVTFRHCSSNETKSEKEKFFSFTYLPLCDSNGTVVRDSLHVLNTFKPLPAGSPPTYLVAGESMLFSSSSPSSPASGGGGGGGGGGGTFREGSSSSLTAVTSSSGGGGGGVLGKLGLSSRTKKEEIEPRKGETVSIRTHLSSTMLTSNLDLSCLLKWRVNSGKLIKALDKFSYIEPQELMKFIQRMFDALFGILEEHQGDQALSLACFTAIVRLISVLIDDKSRSKINRPILDSYIDNHYQSLHAHQILLKYFLELFKVLKLPKPEQKQMQSLRAALKTYDFLVKFIVASRLKYLASQTSNSNKNPFNDTSFHADMENLFTVVREMMMMNNIIAEQTITFRVFGTVFDDLSKFFSPEALCSIVIKFLDASDNIEKRPTLIAEKLVFLRNVVAGTLFVPESSRNLLFPSISKHLQMHMKNVETTDEKLPSELIQCVPIIASMVEAIQKLTINGKGVEKLIQFLPFILEGIISLEEESSSRTELVCCFLAICHLSSEDDLVSFVNGLDSPDKKTFLQNALGAFLSFMDIHTFPDAWYTLCMFQFQVTMKMLKLFRLPMKKYFLTPSTNINNFESEVFEEYFKVCVEVINAKRLQVEQYSAVKRDQLLLRYRDMRYEALNYLQEMWQALGDLQYRFVPDLVPPFLQMIRLENQRLRQGGLDLYFILVEAEFKVTKAFKAVEQQTVDILDQLANHFSYNNEEFSQFFTGTLEKKFSTSPAKVESVSFLNDLKQLLELMSKLRGYPMDAQYEDERSAAILKLMAYLKQTERQDLYVKYVKMLSEMHVYNKHFTEAGMAVMLHADLLKWDGSDKGTRKELVVTEAIEMFDQGKMWEISISLLKEVRLYHDKNYHYRKLAAIATQESTFYRNIYENERFYAEYFRVGYYGLLFPLDYRGKEFIYRGEELEKPADFIARIQAKFPNAEVIQNSSERPGKDITESDGAYLQINSVTPVAVELSASDKIGIPSRAKKYLSHTNVSTFVFSKPFRKGEKSDNEFKDLWIKNTYLEADGTFPTYTRRLLVKNVREAEVSPIENAISSVVAKNEELLSKYEQLEEEEADLSNLLNSLTMQLNGVVDAAVNGGVFKYQDAFFTQAFLQQNPTMKALVEKLREALRNQVYILERGLELHGKLVPPSMRPMQLHLEEFFLKMKQELKKELQLK